MGDDLVEMRVQAPVYCKGCQRYLKPNEKHDEECSVEIERLARKARVRRKGPASFQLLLLLYGLVLCLGLVLVIVWKAGW